MDSIENYLDFNQFKNELNSLPNFYSISNGQLDYNLEKNKNKLLKLNLEDFEDIKLLLEEINKAIQINIAKN